MPALATLNPISQFFDLAGDPLDAGYLYYGAVGDNPETNPVTVYWDAAATQPAAQPVRTLNGYPDRNGTPAIIYASADYSLLVRDRRRRQVLYAPSSADFGNAATIADALNEFKADLAASDGSALVGFGVQTVDEKLQEIPSVADSGAVGDGTTDDAPEFAAQIAATPVGGAINLVPGKTYLLDSSVTINKKLTLYGNGATIKLGLSFNDGGTNTLQALLVTGNDVSILGVSFDASSANPETNNNRFLWFEGDRGRVSDCRFKSLPDGGANVNCAVGFALGADYGSLTESYFEDCPGAGFSQGIGTRMTDNTVINPKDVSFALNSVSCVGGVISDNTIDNAAGASVSGHIAVEEGASGFAITGNTIKGVRDGFGIGCINVAVFLGGDSGLIDGNTVDGKTLSATNPSSLITVSRNYSNIVVSDNALVNGCTGSSSHTILSVGAKNNVVKGNRISSLTSSGLCVYFDANGGTVEFDSNSVTFNGTGACVTFNGDNSNEPAIVRSNTFRNASVGISVGSGVNFPLYHENNAFPSVTNPLSGTAYDTYFNVHNAWQWPHRVMYGHAEMYGNAIPTGGAWRQGDALWNVAPTAAGVPGWRCTADGTPGTWKAMAVLAA